VATMMANDGATQRSMINKLQITFSEAVTPDPGALAVTTRYGAAIAGVDITVANPTGDQKTFVLTFSGPAVIGGSLPDGIYRFVAQASGVHDAAGHTMAADYTYGFHRLFGDFDGDRDVDNEDLALFRQALNRPALYQSMFDYDGDGVVNMGDYAKIKQRLIRRLVK